MPFDIDDVCGNCGEETFISEDGLCEPCAVADNQDSIHYGDDTVLPDYGGRFDPEPDYFLEMQYEDRYISDIEY